MRAIDVHCHPSTREHHIAMGTYMAALEAMRGRKLEAKIETALAAQKSREAH
jgi:hypothetical protein